MGKRFFICGDPRHYGGWRCPDCRNEYHRKKNHEREGNFASPPDGYIPLKEAADILGVTPNALHVRIHRDDWLKDHRIRRGLRGQYFVHIDHIRDEE